MARTVLQNTTLFRSDRSESVYIMTGAVSDQTTLIVTQAEIDASTTYDVTASVTDNGISGFTTSRSSVVVPIMGTNAFPVRLAGPLETPEASITFWADKLGVDVKAVLDLDDVVYVVFAPNGDTAASYWEVWKAVVTSISRPKQFGGEPARVVVQFDIQKANERALIPA